MCFLSVIYYLEELLVVRSYYRRAYVPYVADLLAVVVVVPSAVVGTLVKKTLKYHSVGHNLLCMCRQPSTPACRVS